MKNKREIYQEHLESQRKILEETFNLSNETNMKTLLLPDRIMFEVLGKRCGVFKDNNYLKTVNTKHIFKKTNAWGISDEVISYLKAAQKASKQDVKIILTNQKKKKYEITLNEALVVGQYFQFSGFEKQLFIPINKFN